MPVQYVWAAPFGTVELWLNAAELAALLEEHGEPAAAELVRHVAATVPAATLLERLP